MERNKVERYIFHAGSAILCFHSLSLTMRPSNVPQCPLVIPNLTS